MIKCETSEKAIMATKAALMSDRATFEKILMTADPASVKALGRQVAPFDGKLWDTHLDEVAFEFVRQKFASDPQLANTLLSTGNKIIAEATTNDNIWGIGISVGDPRVQDPVQWQGRNVLGSAMMRTREFLSTEALTAKTVGRYVVPSEDARRGRLAELAVEEAPAAEAAHATRGRPAEAAVIEAAAAAAAEA